MRFQVDHDFHIHSNLSYCAGEAGKAQTPQRILEYAKENGFTKIVVTDHFWDRSVPGDVGWYRELELDFDHVSKVKPLPQAEGIQFLFGCETEMDQLFTIGLAKEHYDSFDCIIVPTTHMHLEGITIPEGGVPLEKRAELYVQRMQALLNSDLPFHKVGLAHMTDSGLAPTWEAHIKVVDLILDEAFLTLFRQVQQKGLGIELNFRVNRHSPEELCRILRPYRLAKACGCKFYLGSDAHSPDAFEGMRENFEQIVDLLALEETDKFLLPTK